MKKILIIEEDRKVRENLAEILQLSAYEVSTAVNGILGVEKALREQPDLILCAIIMPELDGFGVLKIINNNPKLANIPFIFLTENTEKENFRKGMKLGASDFLTRPCTDLDLLEAIEVRLRKNDQLIDTLNDNGFDHKNHLKKKFDTGQWEKFFADKEVRKYRKKSIIFEEGQYPKWLFYIQKGKVKCTLRNADGKEFISAICVAGDFVGFSPIVNETKYEESAYAFEDCTLALLSKDEFFSVLFKRQEVVLKLMEMLAKRITRQNSKLISIAYNSVRKKVAEALVLLYDKYEIGGKAEFSVLRDDLAAMTGTAKETVIRTITDFREEGLIQLKSNVIIIDDIELLKGVPN